MELLDLLNGFLAGQPWIGQALMIMGGLRLVMKPLFSFLNALVEAIPGEKDNEFLKKLEESKILKGLMYILDWFASIKIAPK